MSYHRNPHSLLTPESRNILNAIAKANRPPMYMLSPDQAKSSYASGAQVLDMPAHKMARNESLHMTMRDGAQINAKLWAQHQDDNLPVLLYFHGGGFTVGSPQTHESLCRHIAHLAHCAVVSVDYRLAPEHKFPTAHNDAQDALEWLIQNAQNLRLNAQQIAVGGDSAGGTLAAATAIHARNAQIELKLQVLFYPGCSSKKLPSADKFGKGFLIDNELIDYFYGNYHGNKKDLLDPRFALLECEDVSDVAPVWMGLAECDPIVDEGIAYADYLRMSGVPVDLEIYHGVFHTFIQMARVIPQAVTARMDAARALRKAFNS
jgi:acetyl esterase